MKKLFTPVRLGALELGHRVVMAPLTRSRSTEPGEIPSELMAEYYRQRTSRGGLIIAEATTIATPGRGWFGAPGLYTDEQVAGWRRVVDAVHAAGGVIVSQLWHTGRSSHASLTGGADPVSASVTPSYWLDAKPVISTPDGYHKPSPHRALEVPEIATIVEDYRRAAERANAAGFDGVELHGANGYLPDQFLQDGSNRRTDAYGGAIENRCRFFVEVIAALVSVWGSDRVGARIGPAGTWNQMSDSNPDAVFDHLARDLNGLGLAYLHIIEPRVNGNVVIADAPPAATQRLRKIFGGAIISAGGFEPSSAEAIVEQGDADAVAFGRYFVSNPDLPERIEHHWPLTNYDRATFYTFDAHGYTDYPTYSAR